MQSHFFTKKASSKKILKDLGIATLCLIMISFIGAYYYNVVSEYINSKQLVVLGTEDTFKPQLPSGYELIPKTIDNLEFQINVGSKLEKSWRLGNNNVLKLNCPKVVEEDFVNIPSIPNCTVSLNGKIISSNVRGDIGCDDYSAKSNCTQDISMGLYSGKGLNDNYLFLASGVGSVYMISLYDIKGNSFSQLAFGNEQELTLRGDPYYMAFTDSTKKDFRIVTYYYDNSEVPQSYYDIWKVDGGRLVLENEIAESK